MIIFIPTRNRVGRQTTLGRIPAEWRDRTYLLSSPGEKHEHQSLELPFQEKNLAEKLQWLLEHCQANGITSYFRLDDDLKFATRDEAGGRLRECNPEEMCRMFEQQEGWLGEGFAHTAIGRRFMSNQQPLIVEGATRATAAIGYRADILTELGVKFRHPSAEDIDVALQLLTQGHPMKVSYQFVNDDNRGMTHGGCWDYRTPALLEEGANLMAEWWPNFVKVMVKNKKSWKGDFAQRTDMTIAWKKALQAGQRRLIDGGSAEPIGG